MQPEDKRTAVNMAATLSGQLMAAALAMLTIAGAFAVFALGEREKSVSFLLATGGCFIAFIVSIFFGGKGVSKLTAAGFQGNWDYTVSRSHFDRQAKACVVGLLLLALSTLLVGDPKESEWEARASKLEESLKNCLTEIQVLKNTLARLSAQNLPSKETDNSDKEGRPTVQPQK